MAGKILITGGSGFIGYHFQKALQANDVINYDIQPPFSPQDSVYIEGNILDKDKLLEALDGVDTILHLAATHFDFQKNYFATNVDGTKTLLEAMTIKGVKKIVFYSSVAVYGSQNDGISESKAPMPKPNMDYGKSKYEAEKLINDWCNENEERSAVIIRPAVVYGPYNFGNVFNLIKQIDSGLFLNIGDGKNVKSIVYVENLISYTLELMKRSKPGLSTYNAVDNPNYGIFDLTTLIARLQNKKVPFKIPLAVAKLLAIPFDVIKLLTGKDLIISSKRIEKFCMPTHFIAENLQNEHVEQAQTTEQGIRKTIDWYRAVNWKQLHAEWSQRVQKYN